MERKEVMTEAALRDLLTQYRATGDKQIRNRIVMAYAYIAKTVAMQLRGLSASYAQVEDMVNQGMLTLIDCVDRYDETKGIPFDAYAFLRVRGGVIDLVRKQDWIPRRVRMAAKEIAGARSNLCSELKREPTEQELAERVQMPVEKLRQCNFEIANAASFSFEELIQNVSQMGTVLEKASDDAAPDKQLLRTELREVLRDAISTLGERERLVLTLYYYENLNLTEIAQVLEVSVQRVSQIHGRVVEKLKDKMAAYLTD